MFSQSDQGFRSAFRRIDPSKEFPAWRFDRCGKCRKTFRARRPLVACCGTADGSFIRRKFPGEQFEKTETPLRIHLLVSVDDLLRKHLLRDLAAVGEQVLAEKAHAESLSWERRVVGERLGHRLPQVTCGLVNSVSIRRVPTRTTHCWTHNQRSQWTMGFEPSGT